MLEKIEYVKCELNDKAYYFACLDIETFNEVKGKYDFKPYENLFGLNAFILRGSEILEIDEEMHGYDLYKSIKDFETYLDMAYRKEQVVEEDEELKEFEVRSFMNRAHKIVDYKVFSNSTFKKEFNLDLDLADFGYAEVFEVENQWCMSYSSAFREINCFSSKQDVEEYLFIDGKSIFLNMNPYGMDLLEKTEQLRESLSQKMNIPLVKLDYSRESLVLIDRSTVAMKNSTQHFFYSVYLEVTIYLGMCVMRNNSHLKLKLKESKHTIEPILFDERNNKEVALILHVYKNYNYENKIVGPLSLLCDWIAS